MNVQQLVNDLRRRGITLEPAGDKLRWRGPKGAMTPELLERLRQHKPEVLEYLRWKQQLFSYPLPVTHDLGTEDPLDYAWDNERREWVYRPGWWRSIPGRRLH